MGHLLVDHGDRVEIVGAVWPIAIKLGFAGDEWPSPAAFCPSIRSLTFLYGLILCLQLNQEFALTVSASLTKYLETTHVEVKDLAKVAKHDMASLCRDDLLLEQLVRIPD